MSAIPVGVSTSEENCMARLMQLIEQGVPREQVYEMALYDSVLNQEIVYAGLKRLEPLTDELPRVDLWPGRVERTSRHSHHHGNSKVESRHGRTTTGVRRVHRPWRDVTSWFPRERSVVEIQTRGSNTGFSSRIPRAYHVGRQWHDAVTGKKINSIVERWRMCPVEG